LLDVDVRGDAQQIAEELTLKDFSPYKVSVMNVASNSLVVKLNLISTEKQNAQEE